MGIPKGSARLLLEEHRQRPFSGTILQIGRSTIYFTRPELEHWAHLHQVDLKRGVVTRLSHDPRLAAQGCIDDLTFFELLGFDRVECCDISDWEHADYVVDLNEPLPDELAGRFDVVLDPASSVQLFHQPQLLENCHRLLKVGGRVVHAGVPSNNHMDFGFYMFSPNLFHDFYTANDYQIEDELFCEYFPYWHRGRFHSAPWKVYRYTPGCIDHLNYGLFGGRQIALFVVARKTERSTGHRSPQLRQYVHYWQVYDEHRSTEDEVRLAAGQVPDAPSGVPGGGLAALAERLFETYPWLDRAYLPVKRCKQWLKRRLPQRMPPVVARY